MPTQSLEDIFGVSKEQPKVSTASEFSFFRAMGNIPSSGVQFFGDIFNAVSNPLETAKATGKVISGGFQKAIPGKQEEEENFDQVLRFFQDRYGGKEEILTTMENDPVGFVADVAGFISGVGAATRGVGGVSKVQKISQAGRGIQKLGGTIEPINLAFKTTKRVTRPIRTGVTNLISESLGVTTGAGGNAIRQAFLHPTQEFKQALRGETTVDNVLTAAREGLYKLKDDRSTAYRSQLQAIRGIKDKIDIESFRQEINQRLSNFNVRRNNDGTLNFARSTIADSTEQQRIRNVVESAMNWSDNTPAGLDILKQRLDDFYTPSGKGRSLTNGIRDDLRKVLSKEVPGYDNMTKGYREATLLIDEVETTLSLGPTARTDTTIRKLASALRQNNEFRETLVNRLDEITGTDIRGQLAGTALSPGVPSGLIGRGAFAGALGLGSGIIGGGGIALPTLLLGIGTTSPRVVGEMLRALGLSKQVIDNMLNTAKRSGFFRPEVQEVFFQTGRLEREAREPQRKSLEEIFGF